MNADEYPMEEDILETLRRTFAYAPNKQDGEQWVVYRNDQLLVFHRDRFIKVYRRGALDANDYSEIDPAPWA